MNKVIAAMMIMAITIAMPAMAGNNKEINSGRRDHAAVVNNHKKDTHFDKTDKKPAHFDAHNNHAYHPDIKTCVIKVGRHDSHKRIVAKAEHINGVMDAKWNPRNHEVIVRYDANKTSARHIKHKVA